MVLDTNIIVSMMLKKHSTSGAEVQLCLLGELVPVMNKHILQEYSEVLSRPKFMFPQDIVRGVLAGLVENADFIEAESVSVDFVDASDKIFYEVALTYRKQAETFLVTGNLRHFPNEDFIVSPREMLNLLRA